MNKIVVVNDKIQFNDSNIDIKEDKSVFGISVIELNVKCNSFLFLEINLKELTKLQFNINLMKNVNLNLFIKTSGCDAKIKYNFTLDDYSSLNVEKYNEVSVLNEMVLVNLNGISSKIDYLFKSICVNKENYDYVINHNKEKTCSNIKNNGVNLNGAMNIQITGKVPNGINDCICNQYNRIINLSKNKCEIRPILYIDSKEVSANHSALIGSFEDEELFYLKTMGIDEHTAYDLLIKGFLLSNITNDCIKSKIEDDIKKYWR